MRVELSDEAKQQARKINAWWRANRDAKGLFKEELAAAKKVLRRDAGRLAVYSTAASQDIQHLP